MWHYHWHRDYYWECAHNRLTVFNYHHHLDGNNHGHHANDRDSDGFHDIYGTDDNGYDSYHSFDVSGYSEFHKYRDVHDYYSYHDNYRLV